MGRRLTAGTALFAHKPVIARSPLPPWPRRFAAREKVVETVMEEQPASGAKRRAIALAWIGRSTHCQTITVSSMAWGGSQWMGLVSASTAQIAIRHSFLNRLFDPGAVVIRLTRSASQTRGLQRLVCWCVGGLPEFQMEKFNQHFKSGTRR
ncbi:MAG: hypothetical protein Q9167_001722 [Letrouitia subvulpina]